LSAELIRRSDSTLELSISGKSTIHDVDTSFDIEFTDNAFANGGKADSTSGATNKFVINFINIWTVAATGADFNNIDTAFKTAQNDDIIKVAEGTYTGIVKVISNLTSFQLIGEGPNKTIIQADTIPGNAKGRVFEFGPVQNAYIEGVTIQNGHDTSNNSYGGGISISSGNLTLKNCRVINNWAISRGQGQTVGGGIYCGRDLKIIQSEIANNVCDNRVKQGQIQGGAFFVGGHCIIENSTISGNFSRNTGGAGLLGNSGQNKSAHRIINSTITNNEAIGDGGAFNTYYETVIANSIIYGNKATKGKDIFQTNSHVYTMGITNSFIGDMTGFQDKVKITGTPLTTDPKLDTLAFNCGYTRTHALLDGSPAIDGGVMGDTIPSMDQRGFGAFQTRDIGAHEQVYQLQFEIGKDSICMESTDLIALNGIPNNGTFEGIGVTGNQFDPSKVTTEGYVIITYKYTAPGCDDFTSSDSIYVYKCEVNNNIKRNQLHARIYPNPANDLLWVENNNNVMMNAQISDLSGKPLIRQNDKSTLFSININELPAGVYLLTLESMGMKSVQKFVKLQN
jgi:hypothetical protein